MWEVADLRGFSHDDLFVLAMWAEACEERGSKKVLILPYLPGARMDRGIPNGSATYADFIEALVSPHQIITIDPHSPAALAAYPKKIVTVFPVERIIRKEVQDASRDSKPNATYAGVIAPDKGAHARAAAAAKVMGVPVYTGGKTRDFATGKITGFHMEDELPAEGRFLIVDDICDGGGTFLALAKATGLPPERLDLWVTHGIFSKGLRELLKHFGTIHTTDSYLGGKGAEPLLAEVMMSGRRVKIHELTPYLYPEIDPA
jgi:ribose-phosphate pyrophosphokinase